MAAGSFNCYTLSLSLEPSAKMVERKLLDQERISRHLNPPIQFSLTLFLYSYHRKAMKSSTSNGISGSIVIEIYIIWSISEIHFLRNANTLPTLEWIKIQYILQLSLIATHPLLCGPIEFPFLAFYVCLLFLLLCYLYNNIDIQTFKQITTCLRILLEVPKKVSITQIWRPRQWAQ